MKNLPLILSIAALCISLVAAGYSRMSKNYLEINGAVFTYVGMAQQKDGDRVIYFPVYKGIN